MLQTLQYPGSAVEPGVRKMTYLLADSFSRREADGLAAGKVVGENDCP